MVPVTQHLGTCYLHHTQVSHGHQTQRGPEPQTALGVSAAARHHNDSHSTASTVLIRAPHAATFHLHAYSNPHANQHDCPCPHARTSQPHCRALAAAQPAVRMPGGVLKRPRLQHKRASLRAASCHTSHCSQAPHVRVSCPLLARPQQALGPRSSCFPTCHRSYQHGSARYNSKCTHTALQQVQYGNVPLVLCARCCALSPAAGWRYSRHTDLRAVSRCSALTAISSASIIVISLHCSPCSPVTCFILPLGTTAPLV